jgi:hypothetical protein
MWCTVTLTPEDRVMLKHLAFEVPFTKEFSDVIQPFSYDQKHNGELKPEGYAGVLYPLWIGNGDGGLQWMARTEGGFFIEDSQTVLRVINEDGAARMVINMCDIPTVLEKEHTIDFGFVATPTRKKVQRTTEDPVYHGMKWGYQGFPQGQHFMPGAEGWGPQNYFSHAKEGWPALLGIGGPYVSMAMINAKMPVFGDFGDEWYKVPNERPGPTGWVQVTQDSKSFRDFFVWRYNEQFKRRPFTGYYYDVSNDVDSNNVHAGAGYRRPDGSIATSSSMLGCRDITKRLYNIVIHYYQYAGIGFHDSGGPRMAYMSFATFLWDGENYNSVLSEKRRTYRGIYNPARLRAEYMGHNYGLPSHLLGQARIKTEWADEIGGGHLIVDHLTGLSLLHDTNPHHHVCRDASNESWIRHEKALDKHHWRSPSYRFIPYWHQQFVAMPSEEMYATFYVHEPLNVESPYWWPYFDRFDRTEQKKVIAVFCNESDWEGELQLDLNWKGLGFDDWRKLEVENAVHSTGFRVENKGTENEAPVFFDNSEAEYAKIEDGKLFFPMSEWNYRMIVISEE